MSDVTMPTSEEKTESTQQNLGETKRMKSRIVRQLLHPLEVNDELAFKTIKTVRLDFLTDEAKAPIPRCQALPSHAFSKLTGQSILVSLSFRFNWLKCEGKTNSTWLGGFDWECE